MLDEKAIDEAIRTIVAKEILAGIDNEARDALLQKSIVAAINDYSFRRSVEDAVASNARDAVLAMLEEDEWKVAIETAIRDGFADYVEGLRAAVPQVLKVMLHGQEGDTYSKKIAAILSCWPSPNDGD